MQQLIFALLRCQVTFQHQPPWIKQEKVEGYSHQPHPASRRQISHTGCHKRVAGLTSFEKACLFRGDILLLYIQRGSIVTNIDFCPSIDRCFNLNFTEIQPPFTLLTHLIKGWCIRCIIKKHDSLFLTVWSIIKAHPHLLRQEIFGRMKQTDRFEIGNIKQHIGSNQCGDQHHRKPAVIDRLLGLLRIYLHDKPHSIQTMCSLLIV